MYVYIHAHLYTYIYTLLYVGGNIYIYSRRLKKSVSSAEMNAPVGTGQRASRNYYPASPQYCDAVRWQHQSAIEIVYIYIYIDTLSATSESNIRHHALEARSGVYNAHWKCFDSWID